MEEHTLYHLCKSLHSADSAWAAAVTTGADDITQVCNAIHTLHYHAQPHVNPPVPGALSTLLEDARARIDHLQTTLRRLRKVISGVERWRAELETSRLSDLVDEYLTGLREDSNRKGAVLEEINACELGGEVTTNRWLAVWTECTIRYGRPDSSFIQAFVEAEASLRAVAEVASPMKGVEKNDCQGKLSPAVALLKKRSKSGVGN